MNSKMKKMFVLLGLSLAVTLGFCGCGNEKSEETGIEIKKISEEEVYELFARVEEKAKKIDDARLSMDQGFQEKWDLLKRKQAAANRAFSKNDYNATSKFLQEAEAAADWIMNRGPLRAEADEKYSVLQSRKRESNGAGAPKYASTIYAESEKYEQQGREAYEKIEFEEATRLYVLATNEYKKATSTASAFHAAVYEMNAAKEKADEEKASQFASTIYQSAFSSVQQAIKANARGKYDEALQLLESAENKFENAATTASQFTTAQQKANAAKEKADKESASYRYVPAIYQEALSYSQRAAKANAQGKYDEALQLLDAAEGTFEKAEKEAAKNVLPYLIKSFVKIEEKNYYIGKYEVTQAQWKAVMRNNPAHFKGADRPVENVSWNDAMEFCKKLNYLELAPAGYKFSLPTEAQWEYAARGGNRSKGYVYSGSNDINEVAWYNGNSGGQTHSVGQKQPNELGLYDMSGNVWEWCLDPIGSIRVIRGGSWGYYASGCRVAYRNSDYPGYRYVRSGFRLALVPVQ